MRFPKGSVCWLLWLALGCLAFAQDLPREQPTGSADNRLSAGLEADQGPVRVPEPTDLAVRRYRSGNLRWTLRQAWYLVVPALFLFTGFSAKIRDWAQRPGRAWPVTAGVYVVIFMSLTFVANLPLLYYTGYLLPHTLGVSNQTWGRWFGSTVKSLVAPPTSLRRPPPVELPGLLLGYLFVILLYLFLKKSPRRWWLYLGLFMLPFLAVFSLVQPAWFDPLFHQYGPMKDRALERKVLELARRAGIEGGRVFEVNMSRDSQITGAYVEGFMGAKRIVVYDTTIAKLGQRELLAIMAHEMGHYVLGHPVRDILFISCIFLAAFGMVHWQAGIWIRRHKKRFRFERLDDIASLPLLLLLVNVSLLALAPADLAFARHREHEADRFALELTRDNRGYATAILDIQLGKDFFVPRYGWFYTAWRADHPSIGDILDFANEYRPWETGQPLKYGHLFR